METFIGPDGIERGIPDGRVITFGLSEEQNSLVKAALPARECELFITDLATDLIAISASALIIIADVLDVDSKNMIFDFYMDVGNCTDETVFWIGSAKPISGFEKRFKCYEAFDEFAVNMKYYILSAYRKSKGVKGLSNKLGQCIKILSLIRSCPGIRTKEIAEQMELPIRTVQRRIQSLQDIGEWIEYDSIKKGWRLQYGVSVLYGDHLKDI